MYITMVNLELDHDDIRKEGNVIAYEMKTGTQSDNTLSEKSQHSQGQIRKP